MVDVEELPSFSNSRLRLNIDLHFLNINQWNEFAGQSNGDGYGPNKDIFVDTYSFEFSDDVEPTDLTICAYPRPNQICKGWGFYYLNLMNALLKIHEQRDTPEFTVLAVAYPKDGDVITEKTMSVSWASIGLPPRNFVVAIDGKTVGTVGPTFSSTVVSLGGVSNGQHVLTVTATGASTPFALSKIEVDIPKAQVPTVEVTFSVAM